MSLGENIYKLRTGRKMSQEDFASAMEVSRQSVSKWENNMAVPELEKLVKMAKLFGVSLDELVGNTPTQTAQESTVTAPLSGIPLLTVIGLGCLGLGILAFVILAAVREVGFGILCGSVLCVSGAVCLCPKSLLLEASIMIATILLCIWNSGFVVLAPFVLLWEYIFWKHRQP